MGDLNVLYQSPYISAYNTVAVTVSPGVWTQITLGATEYSGYSFSVVSDNLVVPLAGIYWVGGLVMWNIVTGVATGIYQNGSIKKESATWISSVSGPHGGAFAGSVMNCAASDTIGLYGYQGSGSSGPNDTGAASTYISAFFVGAV
jgi:hypothetical protein